jgi:hypothetical protein
VDIQELFWQMQEPQRWLLAGSIALLLVAIPLKIREARRARVVVPDGPDLRWWRNPEWREAVFG